MSMRAVLLSLATLFGISLWGLAVYSAGAVTGTVAYDGYGVSSSPIDLR